MPEDIYFKKYAELRLGKRRLRFKLATDLFSSFAVDTGSALLLRTLRELPLAGGEVLDLGCGYGPIGLSLQPLTGASVDLVDKDALAVAYSLDNAALNGIDDVRAYPSLGYGGVGAKRFDLIASNLPAKAGAPVLSSFLEDAPFFLKDGGRLAVVVITPLKQLVARCLQESSHLRLTFEKHTKQYSVFHAVLDSTPVAIEYEGAFDRGVYRRDAMTYAVGKTKATVETVWGLPEFDTLSFENQLLSSGLQQGAANNARSVAMLNPGQGHGAVGAWLHLHPERLALLDRDLLSLSATNRNLHLNGCPEDATTSIHHYGFPAQSAEQFDLILMRPRLDEGMPALWEMLEGALAHLAPSGQLLLAGSATTSARINAHYRSQPARVKELTHAKGLALLSLRRES